LLGRCRRALDHLSVLRLAASGVCVITDRNGTLDVRVY